MQDIQVPAEYSQSIDDAYQVWYDKNGANDPIAHPTLVRSLGDDPGGIAFYGVPKDFVRELLQKGIPIQILRIFL